MTERPFFGDVFCAFAQRSQRTPAALAIVAVATDGTRATAHKVTEHALTGPRAMIAALLFALERLDLRGARASLFCNLQAVMMTADEIRTMATTPDWSTAGVDPYFREKHALACRLHETGSTLGLVLNREKNPNLEQARALALKHLP